MIEQIVKVLIAERDRLDAAIRELQPVRGETIYVRKPVRFTYQHLTYQHAAKRGRRTWTAAQKAKKAKQMRAYWRARRG